ncbi:NUDIX domain-containing protein [Roseibium hamelinense]|uniref:NUDIX domain-containing protein n=1 Tax=Roseibium hamelinense TaxID=150831 RepID=A0A562SEZ3_9HYPH|nr:NUDIX hydrolase [Roseibium hamelinense]MTI42895.1 NUDIX hydrolase [Roseibium hamelinense]TWI79927.1 NUDIX domain-containing protein [Roseibium hamelinense]
MNVYFKAYVYLTCKDRLLVFEEPDNPEIGLQVPGGTVDPGESFLQGARREFSEETGLKLDTAFEHFADQVLPFGLQDDNTSPITTLQRPITGKHVRKHFHAVVSEPPAEEWEHFEMTPSVGGEPIRFRLFWLALDDPRASDPSAFFAAFGAPIAQLRQKMKERR